MADNLAAVLAQYTEECMYNSPLNARISTLDRNFVSHIHLFNMAIAYLTIPLLWETGSCLSFRSSYTQAGDLHGWSCNVTISHVFASVSHVVAIHLLYTILF
jgi:hypothetical protein